MSLLIPGASLPQRVPARPVRARRWNTLRVLKTGRATMLAFDLLLLTAIITAVRIDRGALQTVGKDAASGVIEAERIESALADMDADAASALLAAPGASNEAKAYESRRAEAGKALIAAAGRRYAADARATLQSLQVNLGDYTGLIQKAQDLHDRRDNKFLDSYRAAAKLMDEALLPAAAAFGKANNEVLERTYRSESGRSVAVLGVVIGLGVAFLLVLAAMQISLARRVRRIFNPSLLAATLLVWGAVEYPTLALTNERTQLEIARAQAFTSIDALWRARAAAYVANSAEARDLLDPARVSTASAAGLEPAAVESTAFAAYVPIDARVRELAAAGHRREALELRSGFAGFDTSLGAALEAKQGVFDAAVSNGFAALDAMEYKAAAFAAVIGVLILLGVGPRIREYMR